MAKVQTIVLRNGEEIYLNDRELMFCNYYLGECNKNATQSAIKAGLSERTAKTTAAKMLSKGNIQKYLSSQTAPILEALGITHERILRERSALAFTNLTDFVNDDWSMKKKSEIDPKYYPALNQMSIKEKVLMQGDEEEGGGKVISREITFKTADKDKSLAMLEKASGLVKEEVAPPATQITNNFFSQINQHINEK